MYEKIKTEIVEELKKHLPDTFKVSVYEVLKSNQKLEALCIRSEDTQACPIFYLKDIYKDYLSGRNISEIAKNIICSYFSNRLSSPINAEDFKDFEKQKDYITFKLVNTKEYRDVLSDIPNIPFHDLSIIFFRILSIDEEGCNSFLITNNALNLWGISKKELYKIATANLPKLLPLSIMCISTIPESYDYSCATEVEKLINLLPEDIIYIISNKYGKLGFADIFWPDLLEQFGKRFGDFYILPTSVNEAMFVPVSYGLNHRHFRRIIRDINTNITEPADVLSHNIYLYNTETGQVDSYFG